MGIGRREGAQFARREKCVRNGQFYGAMGAQFGVLGRTVDVWRDRSRKYVTKFSAKQFGVIKIA